MLIFKKISIFNSFFVTNISVLVIKGVKILFQLVDIEVTYGNLVVFKEFNFHAEKNEFICLYGPSGIGKTTLMNLLAGLVVPLRGEIRMSPNTRIGYVFQEPRLLPWCNVVENMALGLYSDSKFSSNHRQVLTELVCKLNLIGFEKYYPSQLSGGMKQRVALGRAFAIKPDMLLLDEPFSSLDENLKQSMRELLINLIAWKPCTTVFITHDTSEAAKLGDRVIVLDGKPCRIKREIQIKEPRDGRDDVLISRLKESILSSIDS